jgi:hypothetical protein
MAVAKRSTDLWGYVQRAFLEEVAPRDYSSRTVRLIAPPTVALREPLAWHDPAAEAKATVHLAALEKALAAGKPRRAARCRAAYVQTLHSDRVSHARATARREGLRLEPMGRGPVLDTPTVYYRDRLPWGIRPLSAYRDDRLPPRTAAIVERWNEAGEVFDRYYMADEPRTTCFPTQSLIGVIAAERAADWFVLDRWAG